MSDELPALSFTARVEGVFVVETEAVESTPKPEIQLTYAGVVGDRHEGLTRPSGPREPWYPRGTKMRNERQLSMLSVEELAEVAATLNLPRLPAEWIGANLVLSGIPDFSKLPPRDAADVPERRDHPYRWRQWSVPDLGSLDHGAPSGPQGRRVRLRQSRAG